MFRIHDSSLNRRDFLRVGALGVGGLSVLPFWQRSVAAAPGRPKYVKDKSVVFLVLNGGPPQLETFDPRPDIPDNKRTMTGVTQMRLPGLLFSDCFPRLAAMADKLAVVRSFRTNNTNHDSAKSVLAASKPVGASAGAIYARLAGITHPTTGMMSNALISRHTFNSRQTAGNTKYDGALAVGSLPASFGPFHRRLLQPTRMPTGFTRTWNSVVPPRSSWNGSSCSERWMACSPGWTRTRP